jgi:hypothetical protein
MIYIFAFIVYLLIPNIINLMVNNIGKEKTFCILLIFVFHAFCTTAKDEYNIYKKHWVEPTKLKRNINFVYLFLFVSSLVYLKGEL